MTSTRSPGILHIDRPIVVFDLECTGLDTEKDRIVEIAAVKYTPEGKIIEKVARLNPTIPIPADATAVHGISDADVADAPTFDKLANSLFEFFDGCDLGGYNCKRYDVPLLAREFRRLGTKWPAEDVKIIDSLAILSLQERRELKWALQFYAGKELQNAHSALADTRATLEILLHQATKYQSSTLDQLDSLQRDPSWVDDDGKFQKQGESIVITFGKHQGKSITSIPRDYRRWMLSQYSFSRSTKQVIRESLK